MDLVARFAHANDIDAATSSAYLVFTSTLGFMQFRSKVLTALRHVVTQAESTPSGIVAQVPSIPQLFYLRNNTCSSRFPQAISTL